MVWRIKMDIGAYFESLKYVFPFIKSNAALKALAHVIFRAEQNNSGFYPITIDQIGVGGSVER